LPLGLGPGATPLDAVLETNRPIGVIHRSSAYPFRHAIVRLAGTPLSPRRAPVLLDAYRILLEDIDVHDTAKPYNLLVTRRWMMAVPRSAEFFNGISINALGFAGSLLVRNRGQLAMVRSLGPVTVLRSVV
jgi:ATP adenylyltransferase